MWGPWVVRGGVFKVPWSREVRLTLTPRSREIRVILHPGLETLVGKKHPVERTIYILGCMGCLPPGCGVSLFVEFLDERHVMSGFS